MAPPFWLAGVSPGALPSNVSLKMLAYISICITLCAVFFGFLLVRGIWMRCQARAAIRRDLNRLGLVPIKISKVGVWRNCGSIRAAFWYSGLDYWVECQRRNASRKEVCRYEVTFIPFYGKMRVCTLTSRQRANRMRAAAD